MLTLCLLAFLLSASISESKDEVWTDCGYHSNKVPDTFKAHYYDLQFNPNLEDANYTGQVNIHLDLVDEKNPETRIILNAGRSLKIGPIRAFVQRTPPGFTPVEKEQVRIHRVCRDRNYDIVMIDMHMKDALAGPVHGYVLKIRISDDIKPDHPGLHLIRYEDSTSRQLATYGLYTTFERENARLVFPCLDDPRFPAHFRLKVQVPVGYSVATLNTLDKSHDTQGTEIRDYDFSRTSLVTPQQFGFAIGKFYERSYTAGPRSNLIFMSSKPFDQKMDKVAAIILNAYSKVREINGFLDRIVPTFALLSGVGDLECHSSQFMVADQSWLDGPSEDDFLEDIHLWYNSTVRRIARQWFGGHIVRESADDIWLFDGLLEFTTVRVVPNLYHKKKFSALMQFISNSYWDALTSDAKPESRSIVPARRSHMELRSDYKLSNVGTVKSIALVRVMKEICGSQLFNRILANLAIYRDKSLTSNEFLNLVSRTCFQDIGSVVDSLLYKPGFPLVVIDIEEDGTMIFTSERFRSDYTIDTTRGFKDYQYTFPITLKFARSDNDKEITHSIVLIGQKVSRLECPVKDTDDWYVLNNLSSVGYYRTLYSDSLIDRIFHVSRPVRVPYANLLNLVGDALALVQAGRVGVYYLLKVIDPLRLIDCSWLSDVALKALHYLKLLFRDTITEENVDQYLTSFLIPRFQRRGLSLSSLKSRSAIKTQVWIYESLANLGYSPLINQVLERKDELRMDPNLHNLTFITISRHGSSEDFITLLNNLEDATSPEMRKTLARSLALSSNQMRLKAAWLTILENTPTNAADFLMISLLNLEGREFVEKLMEDIDSLRNTIGIQGLYRVLREYAISAQSRALPTRLTGFSQESISQLIKEVKVVRQRNEFIRNLDIEKLVWPDWRNIDSSSQTMIESDQDEQCD